jgi:hypothetical protein
LYVDLKSPGLSLRILLPYSVHLLSYCSQLTSLMTSLSHSTSRRLLSTSLIPLPDFSDSTTSGFAYDSLAGLDCPVISLIHRMTLYSLRFIRLIFVGLTSNLTELDSPYFGGRVLGLLIVRETLSIDIFGINIHLYIFTDSVTVITPIHPPTPMQKTLKLVVWNCLSSAQPLISTSGSTIRGSK